MSQSQDPEYTLAQSPPPRNQALTQQPSSHFIYCYFFNRNANPRKISFEVNIPSKHWRRRLTTLRDMFAQVILEKWKVNVDPLTLEFWKALNDSVDVADLRMPGELGNKALYAKLSDLKTAEDLELDNATLVFTAEPLYRTVQFVFLDDEMKEEPIFVRLQVHRASEVNTLKEHMPNFELGVATARGVQMALLNVKFYTPKHRVQIRGNVSDWRSVEKVSVPPILRLLEFVTELGDESCIHFIVTGAINYSLPSHN
ncbi:hypothetical protein AX16_003317 [Volvariella volvacea WC 439]|nr:hypothetical protein AX16_003317 [Volvariella volvacea WC 439]